MGGKDPEQMVMGRFYGDHSSNNGEGDVEGNLNKGKSLNKLNNSNNKNIYVGQWDTIREKMVWDSLDKVNEMQLIRELSNGGKLPGKTIQVKTTVQHEVAMGLSFLEAN